MFKFTCKNNFGLYEEFSGYDTIAEAEEAQDRLREKGFYAFSEVIPEGEDYPEEW